MKHIKRRKIKYERIFDWNWTIVKEISKLITVIMTEIYKKNKIKMKIKIKTKIKMKMKIKIH